MSTRTGWVGFFDILGYTNLLERNEPESIAEQVVPLLTETKDRGLDRISSVIEKAMARRDGSPKYCLPAEDVHAMVDDLNWLLFSDTILITMPTDESLDLQGALRWGIFDMACVMLQAELFRAGLPLRGAIDFGRFFVKGTCFAGRPIINAYRLCNTLELAACVVSETASKQLCGLEPFLINTGLDEFVVEYLVPTKDGDCHFLVTRASVHETNIDIRQQVMKAFWGHRKDISIDAQRKAANTEQWLRYLEHLQEKEAFQEEHVVGVLPPPADD
jgi:hypothetical protein